MIPSSSASSSSASPSLLSFSPRRHFLGIPGSLSSLIGSQPSPDGKGTIPVIIVQDAKKIWKEFDYIIDVREKPEVDEGAIPGSVHIPLANLMANPSRSELKGKKVLVYCKAGIRSAKAVQALQNVGIDAVNLGGGYMAWIGDK